MLSTHHKTILQFYESHPNIDFEKANLMLIDLFEYILENRNEHSSESLFKYLQNVESTIGNLRDEMKQSSQHILNLQTSVSELPTHMNHSVSSHMSSIRDYYVKELERVMDSNSLHQQETLQSMFQKDVVDKMKHVVDENVFYKLESFDASIKQEIKSSITLLENGISSDKIVNDLNAKLESKFDQIRENRESLLSIQEHFDRQKNSTLKGIDSENKVELLLNNAFPDACIENKTGESKCCDFLITRVDKPSILIENKDYSRNVPIQEVEKFIRDIEHNNESGIFLSQHTGIARKQNFQIDIHNGCVLIYIHNVEYDFEKVRLAVHTIDYISSVMKQYQTDDTENAIQLSMDMMKDMNKEYQEFLLQRTSLLDTLTSFQKDMKKQISTLEMTSLSRLLSNYFSSTEAKVFKCSYCNVKQFKNAKALAGHTKKCKKEHENKIVVE